MAGADDPRAERVGGAAFRPDGASLRANSRELRERAGALRVRSTELRGMSQRLRAQGDEMLGIRHGRLLESTGVGLGAGSPMREGKSVPKKPARPGAQRDRK